MPARLTRAVFKSMWIALFALIVPTAVFAQVGTITGRVTQVDSGEPLSAVQITVQGTNLSAVTGADGRFTLTNVPAGPHVLLGSRLGFQALRQERVTVTAGEVVNLDLTMRITALQLEEIVVTGLVDPVAGVRSPISVARVSREMMPVTVAGNAVQNLQGRVAGVTMNRNSGEPGSGVSMMLRTPTSLRQSGFPMVVVDGVILGGILADPNTTAIDGMDIESIEIIRGAAAASLYGSRAAAGVISIRTARGQAVEQGRTRFSLRSEYGTQRPTSMFDLPTHHHWRMNEAGTAFVNAQGEPVTLVSQRVPVNSNINQQFMDQPYPGPVFDNVKTALRPGIFESHNLSVMQNTATTNFAINLNRRHEQGAVEGNDGYTLTSFRVNLDHRFLDALSSEVSMFHTRDYRDNLLPADFFTQLLNAPRDVDLKLRDATGQFIQNPQDAGYQNPLWTQATREAEQRGTRTMASTLLRWTPLHWLATDGTVSYDRREQMVRSYVPKGTPLSVGQDGFEDGSLAMNGTWTETWNAEGQAHLRRTFGDFNTRLTGRAILERDRTELGNRSGTNFILPGIPQFNNIAPADQRATSQEHEVRALGYLADAAIEYADRYRITLLGRRDGSSLFGRDNRWHNYYRVAGSWTASQEEWLPLPAIVSDLTLKYSRGTAGGRPQWDQQYETWQQVQGIPTKQQLGNRQLRPEHTLEQELSAVSILNNRFSVELTHAWQRTSNQIVPAPQPAYTGYVTQWVNAGTVAGRSTELTIEGQLLRRANLGWTSMFVADVSNSRIKDWPLPCDATRTWRFDCTGEPVYGLYGFRAMTSHDDLQRHRGGSAQPFADQFQVNDEGYLVWVGGFNYTDGLVNGQITPGTWGTVSDVIGGRTYGWGLPIFEEDAAGQTLRPSLGEAAALNLGWINNFRVHGLNFHAHFQASVGGVANNRAFQDMINNGARNAPMMDQAGKPDGLKKPIGYYTTAVGSGGSNYITEKADYLKLRTLSVNYRLSPSQLQRFGLAGTGLSSLQIGLVGRNLFTITSYSGFDPEQALDLNNRLNAVGTGNYPSTRTFAAEVAVTF